MLSHYFSDHGPLANAVADFRQRPSQQRLAQAVQQAMHDQRVLIAEAGTGTGKTFAYLIPALLSGKKVLISTGTKNLQDQLFHRDLASLRKALGFDVKVALLKGRANYLCHYRTALHTQNDYAFPKPVLMDLVKVQQVIHRSRDGDIAQLPEIEDDSPVWPLVTSNKENCLGQDCSYINQCHLMKVRKLAHSAALLVVNHHLFFSDLLLKQEGEGELLPDVSAVIFDEAHQLPEVASHFFGKRLGSRQLVMFAQDIEKECLACAKDLQDLLDSAAQLKQHVAHMRETMGEQIVRAAWRELLEKQAVQDSVALITDVLTRLQQQLKMAAQRSEGLEHCWQRSLLLSEEFSQLTKPNDSTVIHWYEAYQKSFSLQLTPMSIAGAFKQQVYAEPKAWIFTSATLAIRQDFSHFQNEMGLDQVQTHYEASPFNYRQQALLYVPRYLPDPNHRDYHESVATAAIPVIQASQGRCFFLFTSYRALHVAATLLSRSLAFPLLVQGKKAKSVLLAQFTALGNAVLLGTSSFWQGVDVKGEALSCVIIDKLPFASPGDPVMQGRIEALKKQGNNAFANYQLPKAVIALKQGVGRLIRGENDRGVLMVCDPRLLSADYGKLFIASLPSMRRTRELTNVQAFYDTISHRQDHG